MREPKIPWYRSDEFKGFIVMVGASCLIALLLYATFELMI
jgi:hypothetical protein